MRQEQILSDFVVGVGLGLAGLLDAPGCKGRHGAVLGLVMHFDGMAADFAILDKGLAFHRNVQHYRDLFPAVGACKEVLHRFN
jgi:hypothetical protein